MMFTNVHRQTILRITWFKMLLGIYLLSHDSYRTLPLVNLFDLTWLPQMLISHNGQIKAGILLKYRAF